MAEPAVIPREAVPREARWNDESLFASPQAWEAAFQRVEASLEDAEGYRGRLRDPQSLAAWFTYQEGVGQELGKLHVYANMEYYTNAFDEDGAARYQRVRGLAARVREAFAFAQPELLRLGLPTLRGWLASEPRLQHYRHFLERLEQAAPHTRDDEVEALLGALEEPFASATQAHGVLANTDLTFAAANDEAGRPYTVSQATYRELLASPDRTLRRNAYLSYTDAHLAFRHTMATLLATGVKQQGFLARARRYPSTLQAVLDRQRIPTRVLHSLLDTFRAKLPIWHRYWRVRRRLLALEELHPFDIFAPMTSRPLRVPFEQAVAWLAEALEPLGGDYVTAMRRGALEERWVDLYPNRGKRMGAFSSGVQGTHPFIMMSYSDDVFGMSTLAHELGHSMHSYLAWREQPAVYSSYSLFVAEVASNFHQAMLRHHLLERFAGDRHATISIIEEAMANFYRYLLVMPTLARFELEVHERAARRQALSAAYLSSLMSDLFAEAYGGEMSLERERVGITWATFHTHLYRPFYTFQYATGISGAHALAGGVLGGMPGAAERYLAFLGSGGSDFPLELLRRAGVDLAAAEPVEAAFAVLAGLVERLEAIAAEASREAS